MINGLLPRQAPIVRIADAVAGTDWVPQVVGRDLLLGDFLVLHDGPKAGMTHRHRGAEAPKLDLIPPVLFLSKRSFFYRTRSRPASISSAIASASSGM
jgi:hypothetical protein